MKCTCRGKIYNEIVSLVEKKKGLVFLVIDPPNQTPEAAGKTVKIAEERGADVVCVGGSVEAQGTLLDDTISRIKENCSLPVVLFPGNIATISKKADAVYFMSMMNSLDPYYITGAQVASAVPIKKMGIEPIPTSYIIVEPGRAAGWVGRAHPVPRNLPYLAAATALAGQYMGSGLIILESGGGAPEPAPEEMVAAVKKIIDIPLIVAGGVRTPEFAYRTIKAGADIVHVGTALEQTNGNSKEAKNVFSSIIAAVKKGAKEKNIK